MAKPKMKKVKDFYVINTVYGQELFIQDKEQANRIYQANLRLFDKRVGRKKAKEVF